MSRSTLMHKNWPNYPKTILGNRIYCYLDRQQGFLASFQKLQRKGASKSSFDRPYFSLLLYRICWMNVLVIIPQIRTTPRRAISSKMLARRAMMVKPNLLSYPSQVTTRQPGYRAATPTQLITYSCHSQRERRWASGDGFGRFHHSTDGPGAVDGSNWWD